MAYAILPTPGDDYLCAKPCNHVDCEDTRAKLSQVCRYCDEGMQPGDKYCNDGENEDRIKHWACALAEAEGKAITG